MVMNFKNEFNYFKTSDFFLAPVRKIFAPWDTCAQVLAPVRTVRKFFAPVRTGARKKSLEDEMKLKIRLKYSDKTPFFCAGAPPVSEDASPLAQTAWD